MPSRATITDSASSAKTSPSSWLTASGLLVLELVDRERVGLREGLQRGVGLLASLSGSTPSSPAAITNARFLESHWDARVPAVRMIGGGQARLVLERAGDLVGRGLAGGVVNVICWPTSCCATSPS